MRSSLAVLAVTLLVAPATGLAVDLIWTNGAGGFWNTANNWSPNQVPQPADRVLITNAGAYVLVLTNTTTVNALFMGTPGGAQTLTLASNVVLTVTGTCQLNGGSLQGAGQLTVASQMEWTAGRMFGPGLTRINTGAILNVNPGPSDSPRLAGRRLDNAGMVHWFGRGLAADSGAVVNNLASGVIDVHTNGALSGSWIFSNAGLFRKSAGAGVFTLNGSFNNSNRVEVQAGSLSLSGGGVHSGLFTVANAAALAFVSISPATHTLAGGGVVGGNVSFSGVMGANPTNLPIRIDGGYDVSGSTTVGRGVTVNFTAASTVTNLGTNVFVTGGTLNLDSSSSLSVTNLNLAGGKLTGSNTVTVAGTLLWNSAAVEGIGILNTPGRANLDGTNSLLGWRFNSQGQTFWNSGSIAAGNGSVIHCASNSTFSIVADGNLTGTASTLINSGTLVKSNGMGTTFIAGSFTNFGMVELLAGTLSFSQDYHQAAGSTLLLGGHLATPVLEIAGGLLEGSGYITGSVSNNATVRLGQDRPPLFISGNFQQSSNGVIFIDLPMLATKTNSLVVGGSASLSGLVTNCLDCLLPGFPIPARTNYAFLTVSNPPAPTVDAGLVITFPTNRIGLAVK